MGAGCSSPFRRFGGKKSKPNNRDSISFENNENLDQLTIAARLEQQQEREKATLGPAQPATGSEAAKLNLENEITIQSEAAEDHPSSASYYTDVRNYIEENRSSAADQPESKLSAQDSGKFTSSGSAAAAAKMMGLGGYIPHDRHLLVSPALSPAPSICQSPAPNGVLSGGANSNLLNPNDLNEVFKTLTFGLPNNQANKHRLDQPQRPQSELHNIYAHQLVQGFEDLTNYITIVFITTDNTFSSFDHETNQSNKPLANSNFSENMAAQITARLRTTCDENTYNLRFLNLSHDHLMENVFVNNIQDVAMNIFEQEYRENADRFIVILLANGITSLSSGGSSEVGAVDQFNFATLKQNDKQLLPTRIDAQIVNALLELDSTKFDQKAKDLLKLWYTLVGGNYHLNPVYSVKTDLLGETKDAFSKSWQSWLDESSALCSAFAKLIESDAKLAASLSVKSISSQFIELILKDCQLQKRTLLIRNYSQGNSMTTSQQQQQQQFVTSPSVGVQRTGLSELARQLPDPNKLTIKRTLSDQELMKMIDDWVAENFNKFIDCFIENRTIQGKYPPPFIVKNLFVELSVQRHQLEYHLDNIDDGSKYQNFYSDHIRPLLAKFYDDTSSSSDLNVASTTADTTTSGITGSNQSLVSQPSANHLILISGPKGCGKTTLFAQIIKHAAQDLFNKVQIIYRFCGSTLNSLTPNRLLMSICEQFCQAQGENTAAAAYIYSSRQEIMNSLNKILKQQDCLLFLDGLDSFDSTAETSLDWLCELDASSRIKIIIMLETSSPLYKKALETYTDATYISLDNPTVSEWAQVLTHVARSKRLSSATNLYDELKNLGSNYSATSGALNITYRDVRDTLNMCQIRRLNNEYVYPELHTSKFKQGSMSISDLKHVIHQGVLKYLHYLLPPYAICSFFLAMVLSRNGLSEQIISEIMELTISQLQQKYPNTMRFKFSSTLLSYLKIQLKPWLRYIICDKVVKLTLQKDFLSKAIEYYIPGRYPKLRNEVCEILLEYFNRPFNQSKQKSKSQDATARIRVSQAESLWLETQVSETMNLLVSTNPTKAKEYIMNKDHFYLQFFHRSNPEEFLEDYDRLKLVPTRKASQTNDEIYNLVNFIGQSIFPLRYDGGQIYSQIYCRSYEICKTSVKSKSKKFNDLLTQAACPPINNLLPISEASISSFIKTRIGLNELPSTTSERSMSLTSAQSSGGQQHKPIIASPEQPQKQAPSPYQMQQQQQSKQKIFTISENHRHVIVIYPDKNQLSVWDIYEEKAVRTINNIDQPRDLRMIDQKRAVILCNRELRVYDLDTGQMVTKLKGVMNQKMPYFEVFGQDYVIALARNRMYVNMLNLNTGELETTFKVGEDRFLNSLLVSANGGVCVCGDETQKPFPLLVWNLNERRLMYDLRIERHEFITRMSAISDDGHFVVSVCKQLGGGGALDATMSIGSCSTPPVSSSSHKASAPNFIVIYDLNSGTLFKKWKPGLDTCAVAISLSANRSGKVMNTLVDNSILVWDLATGSKRHTLVGHNAPADVITVQNNRLFSMDSTCRDQSLRIWDIDEGYCIAVFSPNAPVSCCQLSTRGDALVCGFAVEKRLSTLVLCKDSTVNDVIKRNKRRKSSKTIYIFDESPTSRKQSKDA